MDYLKKITTKGSNCLSVTEHESDGRRSWAFYHDQQWHVTDIEPEIAEQDADGSFHVDVKVKEVFDDAESMLAAQQANGFHSWKGTVVWKPQFSKERTTMITKLYLTKDTGTVCLEGTQEHHEVVYFNRLVPSKIAIKVLGGEGKSPAHIRVYHIQDIQSIVRVMVELVCVEQMRIPLREPESGYTLNFDYFD